MTGVSPISYAPVSIRRRGSSPIQNCPAGTAHIRICYKYPMHLHAPSPPMRGLLLRIVAALTAWAPIRNLILWKVRRDAGIPRLPEP